MNTLHLVALLLALLGAQASIIHQPDAASAKPVRAKVDSVEGERKSVPAVPVRPEQLNVVPQVDVAPVAVSPEVEQINVAPPQKHVQAVVPPVQPANVVANTEDAVPDDVIAAVQSEESVSNEVAAPEQLADEVQPLAVDQVEPEGRYIKANDNAPTPHANVTHTHEHNFYKPALFPWMPPPTAGDPTWNYSNYYQNKHPTFPNNFTSPTGLPLVPLLPIPFWKPYDYVNATASNPCNIKFPGDFYIHERSVPHENQQQQPQQPQQSGLQLIGHIYIYKRPQNGAAAAAKPAVPPADDEILAEGFDGADIKSDEQFGNSQLLLQPVVYPVGNRGEVHPQISEIYRRLHLVHPSVEQRSKAPAPVEDSAVLFAVEIPKPIYRFFKSIVGVFSY